jgi:hypothetical protein
MKRRERSQHSDGIEKAEKAEVNQREVARPGTKTEKSDIGEGDRKKSYGGGDAGEFPALVRARSNGLSQENRRCVRNVWHGED